MSDDNVIKLHDGTLINTTTGKRFKPQSDIEKAMTVISKNEEVADFVVPKRRYLDELPAKAELMNPIAVVLMYRLFGMHDDDIAYLISVPVEKIQALADMPEFAKLREVILGNIREFDQDLVRKTLNKNSIIAANAIVGMLSDEDASPGERLSAAKDILDRTGNRPADIVEHRHSINGGLNIRIIKQAAVSELPIIDMEPVN